MTKIEELMQHLDSIEDEVRFRHDDEGADVRNIKFHLKAAQLLAADIHENYDLKRKQPDGQWNP